MMKIMTAIMAFRAGKYAEREHELGSVRTDFTTARLQL